MIQDIQTKLKDIENENNAAKYLRGFLLSYDIPRATIVRLGLDSDIPADQALIIGNKLFCIYTTAVNLYVKYDQVQRKLVKSNKFRFVMLINDKELLALDGQNNEWLSVSRNEIHSEFEFFLPLAGIEKSTLGDKKNANIKIAEKFAQFYNEVLMLNPEKESIISVLLVNLVATLFSDSCGVFNSGSVYHYLDLYSNADGSDVGEALENIFKSVSGHEDVPEYLKDNRNSRIIGIPEYEGGLKFDKNSRKTLIVSITFFVQYYQLFPTSFGSL